MTLGEFLSTSRFPIRIRIMSRDENEICVCNSYAAYSIAAKHFSDCELIDWFVHLDSRLIQIRIHEPEGTE